MICKLPVILSSCLLLQSCGWFQPRHGDQGASASEPAELVRERRDSYLRMSDALAASLLWGWPDASGDAALWASLYLASGGRVDPYLATAADGRPRRNPTISPSQSVTPWSKDMEAGLAWAIHADPDRARARHRLAEHVAYGEDHGWDMCGPAPEFSTSAADRLGRCLVSGALRKTLYMLEEREGLCDGTCQQGMDDPLNAEVPIGSSGTDRHVSTIHRALRGYLGGLNDIQLWSMRSAAASEPRNALYSCLYHRFSDGDTSEAARLLLDERLFPAGRLPSKAEHCEPYLFQRDERLPDGAENPDWLPCGTRDEVRVPVDFLFAARCVLGE